MNRCFKVTLAVAAVAAVGLMQPARADEMTAEAAYADIEQTLGFVPEFLAVYPENGAAGIWATVKALQLNPDTALDGKTKHLIGLAVAAQIPCDYCIYGHMRFAKAAGATDQEIREAVGMAGLTRMTSTFAQGMEVDLSQYKADIDRLLAGE